MKSVRRALAALLLLGLASAAQAEERIRHYLSDVQVQPDSSLAVTETIDVSAENVRINHGIYRDFPTRYKGRNGSQVRVGFTLDGATLDGAPVAANVEPVSNGVRIKLGDADTTVAVGEHSYVLRYHTTRQIGRFKDYDELYWNATGNGWVFPIDVAEARIRLPSAAKFGQRALYTGSQGSTASNAEIVSEAPGDILVRTTQPLGPNEGLTVAVAFAKGVVGDPGSGARAGWWLADYGPPLIGVLGLLGLFGFYYVAWKRAGRDPRAGTVVPLFAPSDDLSPAGMRYVTKMGADNRAFAAALIDMGVRGHVKLIEEDGGWLSSRTRRINLLAGPQPLPADEAAALAALGSAGDTLAMIQGNHERFSAAKNALAGVLKDRYEGKLFKRNFSWAVGGAILFLAALWIAAAAVAAATNAASLLPVGVILGCLAFAAIVGSVIQSSSATGKCLLSALALGAVAVAFFTGMPMLGQALASGWWLPMLIPALALPLVVTAFFWISAPTSEGRAVLDRIAGFKQYLSITEGERFDRMMPPKDTPEIFEKYLPYAIALGVENRWADRFAGVLAAAAAQGQQGFAWYSGSNNPWSDPGGFANSVGDSLSSTISSASTAPGSSSGSGGGGSSGGGGGGGGGGGW
ncbi:MAG: DUF2207 domain-containing protein [Sphingomicrobium sp.]